MQNVVRTSASQIAEGPLQTPKICLSDCILQEHSTNESTVWRFSLADSGLGERFLPRTSTLPSVNPMRVVLRVDWHDCFPFIHSSH